MITRPKKKCTMFATTVTIGSTSAGKSTFLIRLPPEISTLADSSSDAENHVHGRMPQNMNSAYGVTRGSCEAGITKVNTNEYTSRNSSGLMKDQKNPRNDPR